MTEIDQDAPVREGRRAPFKQLPDAVMDDERLTPQAKLTYWYFKRIAGYSDQRARVSIGTLAVKMGFSRNSKRSARGWIDELVSAGWVEVRTRRSADGKTNLVSEYLIHDSLSDEWGVGAGEHLGVGAGEHLPGGCAAPGVGAGEHHGSRRCSSVEGSVSTPVEAEAETATAGSASDGLFEPPTAKPKPKRQRPETTAPDEFELTLPLRGWFRDQGLDKLGINITYETDQCLDWHRAKGSKHRDWDAVWRRWMRTAGQRARERAGQDGVKRGRFGVSATELPADDWRRWVQE